MVQIHGVPGMANKLVNQKMSYQSSPYQTLDDLQREEALEQNQPVQTQAIQDWITTLPIRMDIEAALAYVPPVGLFFLIRELKSNFVRFHAYQASMVHLGILLLHFVIMFISGVLS
jgi:hypothetical protein